MVSDNVSLQAFYGLERSLHALGLVSNKLASIPVPALETLPGLTRLDLSSNRITYIDTMPRYSDREAARGILEHEEICFRLPELEYLDLRMSKPYVECTIEVVEFCNWAEEKIASGKLELVGWNRGNDFYCDDLKRSEIRSFLDYHENHDLIPAQGDPVDRQKIFSQVKCISLSAMKRDSLGHF